ncbi:MAG: ImmA/IrrE family metallo-endopeptidase [Actinobacteria bacterium]|nr:ImmA/IrrE family metallo-endopeptidase [Actinomycetota bacterium]
MARTPDVSVSGLVLKWARDQRGLSVAIAAKRSGLTEEKLISIEANEGSPSLAQLRGLAKVYRRPLIVLLLDEVPSSFQPLTDYRRLPEANRNAYSPELRDEIKRAIQQRTIYSEISEALEQDILEPQLPAVLGDAEKLANQIRSLLNLNQEVIGKVRDSDDAFSFWRSKVEDLGVLVLEASRVEMTEMRGFSIADVLPYVIVLNGADSPRGKIFTLIHELGHLCLRNYGVCDLHTKPRERDDLEVYCNAVAGRVLVPAPFLLDLAIVKQHVFGNTWSEYELKTICEISGGASAEAILRRLVDLGKATQSEYENYRDHSREVYEESRRERRSKKSKGGPPPHRMQLRDRGRPFVRSVFNAYGEGYLSLSDVTEFVGLRVKHLEKLQREAFK